MDEETEKQIKHDLNNALAVLINSVQVTGPQIQEIMDYIKEHDAYHILNQHQMDILDQTLDIMQKQTQRVRDSLPNQLE